MKIAFGSCSKFRKQPDQPAWARIQAETPDRLLLLGDCAYAPNFKIFWGKKRGLRLLEDRLGDQKKNAEFAQLTRMTPWSAVWDDHDFGWNNIRGGREKKDDRKLRAREIFHDFTDRCSTNMPHVYHAFIQSDVKIIMLDVRYYRDKPGKERSFLGEEQEEWFERELKENATRYTVVCSGSTLLGKPNRRGRRKGKGDSLVNYRDYFERMSGLMRERGRVLFLSGDIHRNDFVDHGGFFEAVSSGIGRDKRDNYGIVEFKADEVTVTLKGNKERDNIARVIRTSDWSLSG